MPKSPFRRPTTIAGSVALMGGTLLVAVLACICAAMTAMLIGGAQERTVAWVDARVESVAQALDTNDQTARLLIEKFAKVFGDQFGRNFTLDEAGGRLMQLGIALNGYNNPCDKFLDFTGGNAAVLMLQGSRFVAISSSLKDDKGERALDIAVGAEHPAHAALMRGQTYVGRTTLHGRSYVIRLQPVHDLQDKIVGALFVAFDLSEFDRDIDRLVSGTHFFDSGGVYVVDAGRGDDENPEDDEEVFAHEIRLPRPRPARKAKKQRPNSASDAPDEKGRRRRGETPAAFERVRSGKSRYQARRSYLSAFITLVQAATKSLTNFSPASLAA